jgi:1,4-alpha-glucan branching enzyme
VVHGKGSLVRKMGGRWEDGLAQLRLLYGFQWLHPGKKLLFMGQEFGQPREWDHDRALDWHLLGEPLHRGVMAWVAALNRLYRSNPALALDCTPDGFAWVEGSDRDCSVLVWQRRGSHGESLVAVLHFTPVERPQHWLPVPEVGNWRVLLCSDAVEFGGQRTAPPQPGVAIEQWGRPHLAVDLPGYAVLVLERQADD